MKINKLDREAKRHLRVLNQTEPITRDVEKGEMEEGASPFSAPDAFEPPGANQSLPYEEMHEVLQAFRDDHEGALGEMDRFEHDIENALREEDSLALAQAFKRFFEYAEEILVHNRREEKVLFPLLAKRLVESGECSTGRVPTTAIDVLEADHLALLQSSVLALNFIALAERISDAESSQFVERSAVQQARRFVKTLRLHIFREDDVLFSLAQKLISTEEFDEMLTRLSPDLDS